MYEKEIMITNPTDEIEAVDELCEFINSLEE